MVEAIKRPQSLFHWLLRAVDFDNDRAFMIAAPDYDSPADADGDNVYDVIVRISDGTGGFDAQSIAVTVTDVSGSTQVGDDTDNTFTGTSENDFLSGGGGNDDSLHGLGDKDVLDGGDGTNTLDGGDGSDMVSYASATASVTVRPRPRLRGAFLRRDGALPEPPPPFFELWPLQVKLNPARKPGKAGYLGLLRVSAENERPSGEVYRLVAGKRRSGVFRS